MFCCFSHHSQLGAAGKTISELPPATLTTEAAPALGPGGKPFLPAESAAWECVVCPAFVRVPLLWTERAQGSWGRGFPLETLSP